MMATDSTFTHISQGTKTLKTLKQTHTKVLTFTRISQRMKTLKTLKQTHTKVLKTSNPAYPMLLVQGETSQKK